MNDNGGPAFPANEIDQSTGLMHVQHRGMTLLDYFAGQVLAGWWSDPEVPPIPDVAKTAYDMAAAMLAEKARREGGEA